MEKQDAQHLQAAILPAPRKHLNERRFVLDPSNEVRQQNAVQCSKQAPALLRLRLITRILLAGKKQPNHNLERREIMWINSQLDKLIPSVTK